LSDHLVRVVARHALGPGVPARDRPLGAQQEDRDVPDPVDQLAVALLALAEELVGALAVGHVPGHLREAAEPTPLVPQRGQGDAGPEARAVLADPPTLALVVPLLRRGAQVLVRTVGGDVFRREEPRVGLADDLIGPVSLDALGPRVPAGDVPAPVEHEDRVVPHALDQEPERLLAPRKRIAAGLLLAAVAGGLHVRRDRVGSVAHGGHLAARPEAAPVLPHPPPLERLAREAGPAEELLGDPGLRVCPLEERGIRLPRDLPGGESEDLGRPGAPGLDLPLGADREDGLPAQAVQQEFRLVARGHGTGVRKRGVAHGVPSGGGSTARPPQPPLNTSPLRGGRYPGKIAESAPGPRGEVIHATISTAT